jgi:hypothetical protein
MMQAQML